MNTLTKVHYITSAMLVASWGKRTLTKVHFVFICVLYSDHFLLCS